MQAQKVRSIALVGIVTLAGCASQTGYEKAFSEKSALMGNSQEFSASADQTFRTAKITLVQQGFTIEQIDVATGLIKAVRSLQDPKKKKFAYLITTTVDITGEPKDKSTTITMAASQQTILHKDSEKYFHFLGLVPIPTGRNYQTVVTKEGNVDTLGFYKDFFAAVNRNLRVAAVAATSAPAAVTVSALPASSADTVHGEYPAVSSMPSSAAASDAPAAAEPVAAAKAAALPATVVPTPATGATVPSDSTQLAPLDR